MRRRRILSAASALVLAGTCLSAFGARSARGDDALPRLTEALAGARSYKVRVQAALLLARIRDPRAGEALARAVVGDAHAVVRSTCARLLGKVGGERARYALRAATADRDPGVRRKASAALAELERAAARASAPAAAPARGGQKVVAIGTIGDRSGKAPRTFRERMKAELRALLARERGIQVSDGGAGVTFVIDGTIAKLDTSTSGLDVEVACAIDLVLSRPPRGIMTVASGEAVVSKPRRQFRPELRQALEEEALTHAIRSAHENVARFLAGQ